MVTVVRRLVKKRSVLLERRIVYTVSEEKLQKKQNEKCQLRVLEENLDLYLMNERQS